MPWLLARFGARISAFGRACLVMSGVSGWVSAAGIVGMSVNDSQPWWAMYFLGITVLFLGGLFGIGCARLKLLEGWSALPLATALWMPLAVGLGLVYQWITGQPVDFPEVLMVTGVAGLGGLVLLGYATLRAGLNDRRELGRALGPGTPEVSGPFNGPYGTAGGPLLLHGQRALQMCWGLCAT